MSEPPYAGLHFIELRSLLGSLRKEELAVAGHAVALSQWHAVSTYCNTRGIGCSIGLLSAAVFRTDVLSEHHIHIRLVERVCKGYSCIVRGPARDIEGSALEENARLA